MNQTGRLLYRTAVFVETALGGPRGSLGALKSWAEAKQPALWGIFERDLRRLYQEPAAVLQESCIGCVRVCGTLMRIGAFCDSVSEALAGLRSTGDRKAYRRTIEAAVFEGFHKPIEDYPHWAWICFCDHHMQEHWPGDCEAERICFDKLLEEGSVERSLARAQRLAGECGPWFRYWLNDAARKKVESILESRLQTQFDYLRRHGADMNKDREAKRKWELLKAEVVKCQQLETGTASYSTSAEWLAEYERRILRDHFPDATWDRFCAKIGSVLGRPALLVRM